VDQWVAEVDAEARQQKVEVDVLLGE